MASLPILSNFLGDEFYVTDADVERFWNKVQRTDYGCWQWQGAKNRREYGRFAIAQKVRGEWKYREIGAHRLAFILANGPIDDNDLLVCHRCDNPSCCKPEHLFLGTAKTNHDDCIAKGRDYRGERVNTNKLTPQQVMEIREICASVAPYMGLFADIAPRYGISPEMVSLIVRRKAWKHI